MKIAVIGCGYVGLVTAACLADFGHTVTGVDHDSSKIALLKQGTSPIYEKDLTPLIRVNTQRRRLFFQTSLDHGVDDAEVVFIAVGTPALDNGAADTAQVMTVAAELAKYIKDYKVIVNKSTVPIGAAKQVRKVIRDHLEAEVEFDVVSNPEFLREGRAVKDFQEPDRVVIGTDSPRAQKVMSRVYAALIKKGIPYIQTNLETAETVKYASNAFLATKIAFINEMANLCETVGADIRTVARSMGLDHRIGLQFLNAGPGYGGSCFPKDTKALAQIGRASGVPLTIVETVITANEEQKARMVRKIKGMVGALQGKTLGILGLAFKPDTDDLRESPALTIIDNLLAAGAIIRVYDPQAMAEAKKIFKETLVYCTDPYNTAEGAEALVIITDWEAFKSLDFIRLRKVMASPVLIDLRNLYTPAEVEQYGFKYENVGRAGYGDRNLPDLHKSG